MFVRDRRVVRLVYALWDTIPVTVNILSAFSRRFSNNMSRLRTVVPVDPPLVIYIRRIVLFKAGWGRWIVAGQVTSGSISVMPRSSSMMGLETVVVLRFISSLEAPVQYITSTHELRHVNLNNKNGISQRNLDAILVATGRKVA